MRAAVLVGPATVELHDVPDPEARDHAVVALERGGICGTDLGIVAGRYQVTYPRVLGHEILGRVVTPGPGSLHAAGTRVLVNPSTACARCTTCLRGLQHLCPRGGLMGREDDGGFAERLAVEEARLLPVPDTVPGEAAAVLQVLGTCVHAQRTFDVFPGQSAVVIGLGVTGLLMVQLLRARGLDRVVGITRSAWKRTLAEDLGATATAAPDAAAATVLDVTAGEGADVVIEAVGSVATLAQAVEFAAYRATLVSFGTITGTPDAALPFPRMYYRELTVQFPRAAEQQDYARAVDLVARGVLDVGRLHTHAFELEDVGEAFAMSATPDALKVTVTVG